MASDSTVPAENSAPFEHPFHHIGILVPDIHEAIDRLGDTLGLTFLPPRTFRDGHMEDPDPRLSTTIVTYSRQGPPYIELIQAEKGVYAPSEMGMHHLGLWTPSHADARAHLEERGIAMQARLGEQGDPPFYYTQPKGLLGIRVELCDTGLPREWIDAWINGELDENGEPIG